jgi:hypothetical protein
MDRKVALPIVTSASEVVSVAQIQPFGAACPMASTLPWTTSASGVKIGSPDGSRDSWWSVRPGDGSGDEGHR